MNSDQQRYFKRAIANYGVRLEAGFVWFIDEGTIYFGKEHEGEVKDYLSGYVSGKTFVAVYTTESEALDICGWDNFISNHLELRLIDARH